MILLPGIYPIDLFTHEGNEDLQIRMTAEAPFAITRNFKYPK